MRRSCQAAKCACRSRGSSVLIGLCAVRVVRAVRAVEWLWTTRRPRIKALSEGTCSRNVSHDISPLSVACSASGPGELDVISIGAPLVCRAKCCCRRLKLSLC
eukprot:12887041-Prorocentrum_lima.AAC.1